MTKIGVFDSGIGGLSVAHAIEHAMPEADVIFRDDSKHMPYGNKTPEELFGYVVPILEDLAGEGCQVIVVACNTVTTTIIERLRERIAVPLIGIEPMIKPAVQETKSGVIAVCATPSTLASKRYAWLKATYAAHVTVLEPDCGNWSALIERHEMDEKKIAAQIEDVCQRGADVIVLGCTHYHWIEEVIKKLTAGRAQVIQPEQAVVAQLKRVLHEG